MVFHLGGFLWTDVEIEAEDPAELPPLRGIKIQALREPIVFCHVHNGISALMDSRNYPSFIKVSGT